MTTKPPESFLVGLAKDWAIALGLVIVLFFVWNSFLGSTPRSEGPAPAFELSDLSGEVMTIADLSDGTAILNFWFTSCGPCRHEIPELAKFHRAHPEVPLVGISVDQGMPTQRLAALSKKLGINYTVLHDSHAHVARDFGVDLFPTTFVLHDGMIQHVRMGEVDQAYLEGLLAHTH